MAKHLVATGGLVVAGGTLIIAGAAARARRPAKSTVPQSKAEPSFEIVEDPYQTQLLRNVQVAH